MVCARDESSGLAALLAGATPATNEKSTVKQMIAFIAPTLLPVRPGAHPAGVDRNRLGAGWRAEYRSRPISEKHEENRVPFSQWIPKSRFHYFCPLKVNI